MSVNCTQPWLGVENYIDTKLDDEEEKTLWGEVLPYMGYIGMCSPKGYGFSAVLVINRVSILAYFGHFGHKYGMVFAL